MVYSGLQTKSRLWGKSFSHPRSMHTPFKLSFLPRSSQMKSLYSGKQQALSLLSLGYENQRAKWMFSSENWHRTEGRKCLLQFRHVLIFGEGGGVLRRGPNWPRNQWESHQFCLSSQQGRVLPLECRPPSFFFS